MCIVVVVAAAAFCAHTRRRPDVVTQPSPAQLVDAYRLMAEFFDGRLDASKSSSVGRARASFCERLKRLAGGGRRYQAGRAVGRRQVGTSLPPIDTTGDVVDWRRPRSVALLFRRRRLHSITVLLTPSNSCTSITRTAAYEKQLASKRCYRWKFAVT